MNTELLNGVYDMHIHSFPDVAPRKDDDIGIAKAAAAAGMGGESACLMKRAVCETR